MIDSSNRKNMEHDKEELSKVLQNKNILKKKIPILIFANKQDVAAHMTHN